jgi:hypothetical protein
MHNIKDLRKDCALFAKALEKRSLKMDFKNLQNLTSLVFRLVHNEI